MKLTIEWFVSYKENFHGVYYTSFHPFGVEFGCIRMHIYTQWVQYSDLPHGNQITYSFSVICGNTPESLKHLPHLHAADFCELHHKIWMFTLPLVTAHIVTHPFTCMFVNAQTSNYWKTSVVHKYYYKGIEYDVDDRT